MRKSKRVISKSKMYGFNPWMDQLDAINQIMADTGEKSESAVLRTLIDEALAGRRQQSSPVVARPELSGQEVDSSLETIQTLLVNLIRQGETSLRIQDLSLALTQDALAEAHAGRKASWISVVSSLKDQGLTASEIARRFEDVTREARNYAYGVAEEIKKSQNLPE